MRESPHASAQESSEPGLFRTDALATTTRSFRNLLANLDRRLHVMAPALELAESALCRHLALEVLDCTLDATISNLDLERPTLYCFARISHGGRDMADVPRERKPEARFFTP